MPSALVAAALPRAALAEPRVGAPFPACWGRDLTRRWHTHGEIFQRRTFVSVITGQDAATQMRLWLDQAEARFGRGGPIVAIVALDLGVLAWDGIVWDRARSSTPAWRHGYVWLDREGALQRALGLPDEGSLPWNYVVDRGGRVLAACRGVASDPSAQRLWDAMTAP